MLHSKNGSVYGTTSGVDPGFSEGGANGNAWPHGCGKGEDAMEAFTMCA